MSQRGASVLSLIDLYRALGGGWETQAGQPLIDEENRQQMEQRIDWGDLLEAGVPGSESGNQ